MSGIEWVLNSRVKFRFNHPAHAGWLSLCLLPILEPLESGDRCPEGELLREGSGWAQGQSQADGALPGGRPGLRCHSLTPFLLGPSMMAWPWLPCFLLSALVVSGGCHLSPGDLKQDLSEQRGCPSVVNPQIRLPGSVCVSGGLESLGRKPALAG